MSVEISFGTLISDALDRASKEFGSRLKGLAGVSMSVADPTGEVRSRTAEVSRPSQESGLKRLRDDVARVVSGYRHT